MHMRTNGTNDYRFGFNGQEKDDEIYGAGNSTTAEFWQYDARLGRRWNLDPKPKLSESPYATFAGNPILYVDHLGDTARVAWSETDAGGATINKKASYINDQWVGEDNVAIVASKVKDPAAKQKMEDYSLMNSESAFDVLTDEINSTASNVNLLSTQGPHGGPEVDANAYLKDKFRNGISAPDVNVHLSPVAGVRSDVLMSHELGHVKDLLGVTNMGSSLDILRDNGTGCSNSEVNAMYYENIMRSLHGEKLRQIYDPTINTKAKISFVKSTTTLTNVSTYKLKLSNLDGTQTYTIGN